MSEPNTELRTEADARGWRVAWGAQTLTLGRNGSLNGWTHDGPALIYVSPLSQPDKRLRGGMPVCWPWFGMPPEAGLPPHGFLLDRDLAMQTPRIIGNQTLEIGLAGDFSPCAGFPGQARVAVDYLLTAAETLTVSATIENTSTKPIAYALGFHPYLALPAACGALSVSTEKERIDVPDMIDQRFAYDNQPIDVAAGGKTLWRLHAKGMSTLGLWKIDALKAASIADLPDDAHAHFICVNPVALHEALGPGEKRQYQLTLEPVDIL